MTGCVFPSCFSFALYGNYCPSHQALSSAYAQQSLYTTTADTARLYVGDRSPSAQVLSLMQNVNDLPSMKGPTMKMPYYSVVDANGTAREFHEKLEDAKRGARLLASKDKADFHLMVPSFRFSPKETPVDEVDLVAGAAGKKG